MKSNEDANMVSMDSLIQLEKSFETYKLKQELLSLCKEKVSILRWLPTHIKPDEGSYILIKYLDREIKMVVCIFGCFENGIYMDSLIKEDVALEEQLIMGWCYAPYSGRL